MLSFSGKEGAWVSGGTAPLIYKYILSAKRVDW